MEKERQALTAKYNEDKKKHEQEFSDLAKQKREVENGRVELFEFKKKMAKYLNSAHNRLRGKDATNEIRKLERINAQMQHDCRRGEQGLEQRQRDIEKRQKRLSEQSEKRETQYHTALRNLKKEGAS